MSAGGALARALLGAVPDPVPRRQRRLAGRHALVDGIPFTMPIDSADTPALMTAFAVNGDAAAALLPAPDVLPLRLPGGRGVLVLTVVNYAITDIGSYIEFSVALACRVPRGGLRPPAVGQWVLDLPVSTEVSVKGGRGIWGMPKHRAALDFRVGPDEVSSQYDDDGRLALRVSLDRPGGLALPVRAGATNYCAFRGMLVKSRIYFQGEAYVAVGPAAGARLLLGDAPRAAPLHSLQPAERPLFTAFLPSTRGILDDHVESWFLTSPAPVDAAPEGLEQVVGLGVGQDWPPAPSAAGRLDGAGSADAGSPQQSGLRALQHGG